MALVFIKKSGEKTQTHVPWEPDFVRWVQLSAGAFSEIHADGAELEYLKRCFVNIPYRHSYTTWSGDWALFIANNFPHYMPKKQALEEFWKSDETEQGPL